MSERYLSALADLDRRLNPLRPTRARGLKGGGGCRAGAGATQGDGVRKVEEFLMARFYSLRKPKTNVQMQQNSIMPCKYLVAFLANHARRS